MTDRYIRQSDLIDQDQLNEKKVIVAGCGAVGSQIAQMLARIGLQEMTLVDFDTVEEHNLANQGFDEIDLGENKAVATAHKCSRINSSFSWFVQTTRVSRNHLREHDVIFSGVDTMEARRFVWTAKQEQGDAYQLYDTRMRGGDVIRVLSTNPADLHYERTLFTDEEAQTGRCTDRSTIYAASIAAAVAVQQFVADLQTIRSGGIVEGTDRFLCLSEWFTQDMTQCSS